MYFPCALKYGYPDLSASASPVPRILLNWRGKEGEGEVGEVQVAEELMGDGDGEGDGVGGGGGVAAPQISPAHKETLNVCERACIPHSHCDHQCATASAYTRTDMLIGHTHPIYIPK